MHGSIMVQLQSFVESQFGAAGWQTLLDRAGLNGRAYEPFAKYPDREALALVRAACEVTGATEKDIQRGFGKYIAPRLLEMYWAVVDPSWRALDLIEHTEEAIHRVVRLQTPDAEPPALESRRVSEKEVVITYSSGRSLCYLLEGIAEAVGEHYGEVVRTHQEKCMRRGDPSCVVSITRVS